MAPVTGKRGGGPWGLGREGWETPGKPINKPPYDSCGIHIPISYFTIIIRLIYMNLV